MKTVRLHPWRDGVEHCLRLVEEDVTLGSSNGNASNVNPTKGKTVQVVSAIRNGQYTHLSNGTEDIQTVDVCFHEQDISRSGSSTTQQMVSLDELFHAIGRLQHLESLIVRYSSSETSSSTNDNKNNNKSPDQQRSNRPIVWVSSLTTVLTRAPPLKYLTLIGVPLVGDALDMNGFAEALRIHPGLVSIAMRHCLFGTGIQKDQVQEALSTIDHADVKFNEVMEVQKANDWIAEMSKSGEGSSKEPWWNRFLCCAGFCL